MPRTAAFSAASPPGSLRKTLVWGRAEGGLGRLEGVGLTQRAILQVPAPAVGKKPTVKTPLNLGTQRRHGGGGCRVLTCLQTQGDFGDLPTSGELRCG